MSTAHCLIKLDIVAELTPVHGQFPVTCALDMAHPLVIRPGLLSEQLDVLTASWVREAQREVSGWHSAFVFHSHYGHKLLPIKNDDAFKRNQGIPGCSIELTIAAE